MAFQMVFWPPTAPAVPEYTEQLRLSGGHDQRFFEQAVKLYIFARHNRFPPHRPETCRAALLLVPTSYTVL